MATIQITPEVLRSKATDVRTYKGEHDEVINKLRTLINGLNETWKGDAQTAFVSKFESMQSTFTNFSEMLEGYAKLMDTAAQKMEEADLAAKGTIDSFT